MTLTASNLSNGSKLMLMASQGLYQGVYYIDFLSCGVIFFAVGIMVNEVYFFKEKLDAKINSTLF